MLEPNTSTGIQYDSDGDQIEGTDDYAIFPIIAIARIDGDIEDIFSWDFVPNNDNYKMAIGLTYSSSDEDEMFR